MGVPLYTIYFSRFFHEIDHPAIGEPPICGIPHVVVPKK
jgi:hypothetical protein